LALTIRSSRTRFAGRLDSGVRPLMRLIVLLAALLIASCSTAPSHVGYCSVLEYAGAKGEPYGLVVLNQELEVHLRALLPPDRLSDYVCWYATGTEILAASRHDRAANYGIVFEKSASGWKLSDEPPRLLELPRGGF
jgi:hypothetical protein